MIGRQTMQIRRVSFIAFATSYAEQPLPFALSAFTTVQVGSCRILLQLSMILAQLGNWMLEL